MDGFPKAGTLDTRDGNLAAGDASTRKFDQHARNRKASRALNEDISMEMAMAGGSAGMVPYGADQTVYVVVDGVAVCGGQETQVERTDFDTVVNEFMAGQFHDPRRVVAFNTLEHWSEDLSAAVAEEIQTRCDIEGMPVPEHIRDFFDRHRRAIALRRG